MDTDSLGTLLSEATSSHLEDDRSGSIWAAWNVDPELLIPVVLGVSFYLYGLTRWTDRHREHPRWRTIFYISGLTTLVLTMESPLDLMSDRHFMFHMLQHELLLMVVPPLVLLGAPTTPILRGMPRWLRFGLVRPLARRPMVRNLYRVVTHPLVALFVLTVTLWAWHFAPGWYDAALRDELVHSLQHLSFLIAGMLFWWNVIDPAPLKARMAYPVRMVYLLVGGSPKHFIAAFITFASEPLYTAYEEVVPILLVGRLEDQVIGGLIMWAPSQMMHLLAVVAVFFIWAHKSEKEQAPTYSQGTLVGSRTEEGSTVRRL